MSANLQNPIFTDEAKAREWLEAQVWPNGPVCPHCGATDDDVTKLEVGKHRPGLFQCNQCRQQRGMKGVYQHCGEKHLHRYLAEYDFRYNTRTALGFNDLMRAEKLAGAIAGKRLTYRRPHGENTAEAH